MEDISNTSLLADYFARRRGALLVDASATRRIAPVRVEPVDTTGAGDAFIGSFAHFFTEGMPVFEALTEAAKYAADSITRRGTQRSYATLADFRARFARFPVARCSTSK